MSFYEIPLVCPAAPQIGCGSASKPLLLGLESSGVASEAWLNRAGTIMAVVWSEKSTSRQRSEALNSILKEAEIEAKELTGAAKRQALNAFQQKTGWYRGAEVDRLSEEEAGVIAGRLVRRIRAKIVVTDEKANAIEQGFVGVLKQKLTGKSAKNDAQEAMIKICRENLSEKDVAILQEAFAAGVCPLRDEK
jgi:L-lactate utilization protein LutC